MPSRRTSSKRPAAAAPPEDPRFAAVAKAFAADRRVTHGMMMATIGLKVGGKIFVMSRGGELIAKLPRERVDALVAAGHGERFDPRRDGRLMKEWVVLRDGGPDWVDVAREAHRFVAGKA
jgi:hypothetical protein